MLACKKVLDVNPEYQLDGSNRFNTIDDYEAALIGAYRLFQSTSYYGSDDSRSNAFVTLPDILSDNLEETSESLGNERSFAQWTYAANDDQIERTWTAAYRIISQANLTLQNIDKFSATKKETVNRIKGQALAIRAMVHFDILRYWVEDYDRNSGKPGIPYVTQFDYEKKPSRGTVKQSWDSIEDDLKVAKMLLSQTDKNINSSSQRAYIDSSVVNAIFARMYLYNRQWDDAIKYATYVIDKFPLADRNTFPKIWRDASTDEVVWSLVFDAGQGSPANNVYFPAINVSSFMPSSSLRALYTPGDIRYNAYFDNIANKRGIPRIVLVKYLAKEAQITKPDGTVNFKAFRTAEMYLVRAESYAAKGGANEVLALDDLNRLRTARIANFIPGSESGADLWDAIANERRKELIAEGHRWFDLKRTTRTIIRTNCTSYCTLPPTSRAWNWPIPQREIDANPNILPQNPGY
jgi:hypothetical protein